MLNYQDLKSRAINLKSIKASTCNYFTLSDVVDDYEILVNELLKLVEEQQISNTQLTRFESEKRERYYD